MAQNPVSPENPKKDQLENLSEDEILSSKIDLILSKKGQARHLVAVIEAIEAVIEKRATDSHLQLEISGVSGSRKISEAPMAELIKVRDKYILDLKRLRLMDKNRYPKNIVCRFT